MFYFAQGPGASCDVVFSLQNIGKEFRLSGRFKMSGLFCLFEQFRESFHILIEHCSSSYEHRLGVAFSENPVQGRQAKQIGLVWDRDRGALGTFSSYRVQSSSVQNRRTFRGGMGHPNATKSESGPNGANQCFQGRVLSPGVPPGSVRVLRRTWNWIHTWNSFRTANSVGLWSTSWCRWLIQGPGQVPGRTARILQREHYTEFLRVNSQTWH